MATPAFYRLAQYMKRYAVKFPIPPGIGLDTESWLCHVVSAVPDVFRLDSNPQQRQESAPPPAIPLGNADPGPPVSPPAAQQAQPQGLLQPAPTAPALVGREEVIDKIRAFAIAFGSCAEGTKVKKLPDIVRGFHADVLSIGEHIVPTHALRVSLVREEEWKHVHPVSRPRGAGTPCPPTIVTMSS
ncbi:hypothetical protein C8Q79DRAFT_1008203 [Trametes meyenii]|nr:hypothetical protein C8Q79DRAFT_1008203 [Trametes meyenii]